MAGTTGLEPAASAVTSFLRKTLPWKAGQREVIARQQVYRVSLLGKNRKRNALIGTGVGAAAGLGVGLAIMERESGFGGAVAGLTVGYAGVGAGVGALMPASKLIYRAEAIPRSSPNKGLSTAQ